MLGSQPTLPNLARKLASMKDSSFMQAGFRPERDVVLCSVFGRFDVSKKTFLKRPSLTSSSTMFKFCGVAGMSPCQEADGRPGDPSDQGLRAFGYTHEALQMLLLPMANNAYEVQTSRTTFLDASLKSISPCQAPPQTKFNFKFGPKLRAVI